MILVKTPLGIKKTTTSTAKTVFNNFNGWYCGAGMDFLWINSRGKIFGNVCRHSGTYGNVYNEFKLPTNPMICPANSCYCASDIQILKSKNQLDFNSLNDVTLTDVDEYNGEEVLVVQKEKKGFSINWNLGRRCNYNCSYCPPEVHDNFSPHVTFNMFKKGFDNLNSKINFLNNFKITFTGGEPTINPEYYNIVDYAGSHGAVVVTNTNGTANIEKLIRLMKSGGLHISVHTEFYNPKKLSEKIIELSKQSSGFVILKYMLIPGKLEECKKFLNLLPKNNEVYKLTLEPLVDKSNNNKILEYTSEELKFIRETR